MNEYPDFLPALQARKLFLNSNGFDEADDLRPWNKVRVGWLVFYIPNPPKRQKAIPLHDLHHVLTGYETTFVGEGEIAAWELASGGLGPFKFAAPYVYSVFLIGLLLSPRTILRAYRRGRGERNLFVAGIEDRVSGMTLGDLRRRLRAPYPERGLNERSVANY